MRKETIHIRIDDAEKRKLMQFAKATGHGNLSTWTRHLMTESVAVGRDGTALLGELSELRSELSAIGNNVNQIAKQLNSGNQVTGVDDELKEISHLRKRISTLVYRLRAV